MVEKKPTDLKLLAQLARLDDMFSKLKVEHIKALAEISEYKKNCKCPVKKVKELTAEQLEKREKHKEESRKKHQDKEEELEKTFEKLRNECEDLRNMLKSKLLPQSTY